MDALELVLGLILIVPWWVWMGLIGLVLLCIAYANE